MAERSFAKEVGHLGLGTGEETRGEGILALTKALPQSVGYVGGYQGAPILQPMDALTDARDILADLGVRFTGLAAAATLSASFSASLMYPIRGTATFESTVGTDVAADALALPASGEVAGGAVIIAALQGAQVRA